MRKQVLLVILATLAASCALAPNRHGGLITGATDTACASTVDTCTCSQPNTYGPSGVCYPFNSSYQFFGINRANGMPEIYGSH